MLSETSDCQRPLLRALGDAAACAYCGADRGEPCRLPLIRQELAALTGGTDG